MKRAAKLAIPTLLCVMLLMPCSMAIAKVLPGPAIVADANVKSATTEWSSSVTVCKGQTVSFSALGPGGPDCTDPDPETECTCVDYWSYDLDYESDPHLFCADISFIWNYSKDGGPMLYLGSGPSFNTSFAEVGTYTCVVTVSDGEPEDGDDANQTASVTVIVGEISSMTGPDQCVLCTEKDYTWSVDACCCDDVLWTAYGGLPSFQIGGCSFTTRYLTPAEGRLVSADCGASHKQKAYTVETGCDVESEPPDCQLLFEFITEQPASGCTFGETAWWHGGGWPVVCFDCPTREEWVVKVTGQLRLNAIIVYDRLNHQDDNGTCDTVESLLLFWDDASSRAGGGPGDDAHCDAGQAPYWSYICTAVHEHAHVNDICAEWRRLAASAKAQIEALWLPPTEPYCTSAAASNVLMPQALDFLDRLYREMDDYIADPQRERTAYEQERICLESRINSICQSLPPGSCPACEPLPF